MPFYGLPDDREVSADEFNKLIADKDPKTKDLMLSWNYQLKENGPIRTNIGSALKGFHKHGKYLHDIIDPNNLIEDFKNIFESIAKGTQKDYYYSLKNLCYYGMKEMGTLAFELPSYKDAMAQEHVSGAAVQAVNNFESSFGGDFDFRLLSEEVGFTTERMPDYPFGGFIDKSNPPQMTRAFDKRIPMDPSGVLLDATEILVFQKDPSHDGNWWVMNSTGETIRQGSMGPR